ncbi:MAG: sulfite exporter TauE/SafE family protein, partial [bacterium]|nr:sulfite exporter TauE/SafE family protein [bacterium]
VAFKGFLWRRSVNWRIVASFASLGVLFSFLGAYLIAYLPAEIVLRSLGVFLVIYSLYSLTGHRLAFPLKGWVVAGAGGLDGFLAGLIGTAGALRTAFLSSFNLQKNEFLGTSFAVAFFVDLTRVATYWGSGVLEFDLGVWSVILVVAVAGSLVGRKLVFKLHRETFYKAVYLALLLAGVKFILG